MINKIQNRRCLTSPQALLVLVLCFCSVVGQLSQHSQVSKGVEVEMVRLEAFQMSAASSNVTHYFYRRSYLEPLPATPTVCLGVGEISSEKALTEGWLIYLSRADSRVVEVGLSMPAGHSYVRFGVSTLTVALSDVSQVLQIEVLSVSVAPYRQTKRAQVAIQRQIELISKQVLTSFDDSPQQQQFQVAAFLTGVPFYQQSAQIQAVRVELRPLLLSSSHLQLVFHISHLPTSLPLPSHDSYHAHLLIVQTYEALRRHLIFQTIKLNLDPHEIKRIRQPGSWGVLAGLTSFGGRGPVQTGWERPEVWRASSGAVQSIQSLFLRSWDCQGQLLDASSKQCNHECLDGSFQSGNICLPCGQGCLRCGKECSACAQGFQLVEGRCRTRLLSSFSCENDADRPYALTCEWDNGVKEVKTCEPGYYVASNKTACLPCVSTFCKTCNATGCTSCYGQSQPAGTPRLCLCQPGKTWSALPNPNCQGCTSIVKDCKNCGLNFFKNQSVCLECDPGLSLSADNMSCIVCPSGCSSCVSLTNCTVCTSNLTTSVGGVCVCNNAIGYFTSAGGSCVTCSALLTGCTTCLYISTALSCSNCTGAYVLNSSNLCTPCSFKCTSCNATTCLTCATGFVITGTICACPAGSFLNTTTNTCTLCSIALSGCSLCTYSGGVLCSDCSTGLIPSGTNTSCIACPSQCSDCVSATVCLGCVAPFIFVSPNCVCDSSPGSDLYLSTTSTACVVCSSAISHCLVCLDNGAAATTCFDCETGFFPSGSTCAACPMGCSDCSSLTACSCENGYDWNVTSFACECQASCQACSALTNGCAFCPGGNCDSCQAGFFLTVNSTCQACSGVCLECSGDPDNCVICVAGYTSIGGGQCICEVGSGLYFDATLTTCVSCDAAVLNCSTCSVLTPTLETICLDCEVGFYSTDATTCTQCPSTCTSCTSPAACTLCVSGFALINGSCECANSLGFFYDAAVTHTCVQCSDLVANCETCTNLTLTSYACVTCVAGMYPSLNVLCSPCPLNCGSCLNASFCLTCPSTFIAVPVDGVCVCDNSSNLFLDSALMICELCSNLINYCTSCGYNGSTLICLDCLPETYPSGSSCLLCPPFCFHCNDSTSCDSCDAGYELDAFGLCICGSSCANCSSMVANCSQCDSSGCLACAPGYYLLVSTCQMCPSECVDCNSFSVCTLCQPTFTLTGTQCLCDASQGLFLYSGSCAHCNMLFSGCLTCTATPSLQCQTCQDSFYMDANGTCLLCDPSCQSCNGPTANSCTDCPLGKVLNGLSACVCDTQCQACSNSSSNCISCSYIVAVFDSCLACDPGYYLSNSTTCTVCSITDCVDCSSPTTCTLCANSFSLSNGNCICDTSLGIFRTSANQCAYCIDLDPLCVDCQYGGAPTSGVSCANCTPGYYPQLGVCSPCINGCNTCNSTFDCMVCAAPTYALNLSSYQCECNAVFNYFFNGTVCEECSLFQCLICANLTACSTCHSGYFLNSSSLECEAIVCGDGTISVGETCDDANNVSGDGCSASCLVEIFFVCSGTPSVCSLSASMNISLTDIVTVVGECNRITFSFSIDPYFPSFDGADFTGFMHVINEPSIKLNSWVYLQGTITYNFELLSNVQDKNVTLMFLPSGLTVPETANYTYSFMTFPIQPSNNVKAYYYPPEDCSTLDIAQKAVTVMEYATYATMIVSILPCKIVGLEMIGVLQLSFFTVGSVDTPNLMMRPLLALKSVNGFNLDLGSQSSRRRMLTGKDRLLVETPTRIQNISYSSNFLRNCNVMLGVVSAILIVSAILYSFAFCFQKCAPCLWSFSRRAIKEVLLTLVLFNCFNFAYSAGLHFAYASREDSLYLLGTLAAVSSIALMVGIAVGLMASEEQGYGEYKDKLKDGCVEKGYFVVTIVYRMGLGIYLSSENENELSTLLVLGFSILWLLYNLVNLPFKKAYHNYRANLCHLTQFICLFVTMYYRSMKSTSDPTAVSTIYSPVYIEYCCISLSFLISIIVLFYEIYIFFKSCCTKDQRETPQGSEIRRDYRERKESQVNLNDASDPSDPNQTLGNIDMPKGILINQNFSQDYDEYQ